MPSNLTEKGIETYLRLQVKEMGGRAYKFTSPQQRSVPDRICVFPGGCIYFVEVKKPTGKLSEGQRVELNFLRALGCNAITVWSVKDVNQFIRDRKREVSNIRHLL